MSRDNDGALSSHKRTNVQMLQRTIGTSLNHCLRSYIIPSLKEVITGDGDERRFERMCSSWELIT